MIIPKENKTAPDPGVWSRLPKVELHRHLEGSVTPELLLEISGKYGVKLPTRDLEELRQATQIRGRAGSLQEFLQRFYLLGLAFPSVEAISEVAYRVCRDCARDRIRVLELRFSPVFMSIEQPHPWEELVEAVWAGVSRAQNEFPIRVGLIIGISRSNGLGRALEVVDLVVRSRDRGVLGIDLFGDEAQYPPELFAEPFAAARRAGLNITVHAGEGGGETNIRTAVEMLGASRIGHGVRVINDPEMTAWLAESGIPLEICLTSNVHTRTVESMEEHPVRLLYDRGVRISLNTDDPGISDISLSGEYELASRHFRFSLGEIKGLILDALNQSFLAESEKERIRPGLVKELNGF